jgi:hypothetical protein
MFREEEMPEICIYGWHNDQVYGVIFLPDKNIYNIKIRRVWKK